MGRLTLSPLYRTRYVVGHEWNFYHKYCATAEAAPLQEQYLAWNLSSVSVGHQSLFQHDWYNRIASNMMSLQTLCMKRN